MRPGGAAGRGAEQKEDGATFPDVTCAWQVLKSLVIIEKGQMEGVRLTLFRLLLAKAKAQIQSHQTPGMINVEMSLMNITGPRPSGQVLSTIYFYLSHYDVSTTCKISKYKQQNYKK